MPGDNPGARNQGADDGLDVLVQPDGGWSGGHHVTLTCSARQRQSRPISANLDRPGSSV